MFEDTISVVSIWAAMNSWLTPTVLFVVLNIMIGTIAVTSGLGAGPRQQQPQTQDQDPAGGQQQEQIQHPNLSPLGQLTRSPSIVLQRLRSIKLYRSEKEPASTNPLLAVTPSAERVTLPSDSPDPVNLFVNRRFDTQAEKENVVVETGPIQTEPLRENLLHVEQKRVEPKGERQVELQSSSLDEIFSQIKVGERNNNTFTRSKSDKKPGVAESSAMLAATVGLGVEKKVVPKKRAVKKSASDKATFSHFEVGESPVEEEIVVRKRVTSTTTPADEEVDAKADDFINRFREQLKLQRMESVIDGGGPGIGAGN